MDETTAEVMSRLDALAAKMGTTAEYLWTVMVEDVVRRGIIMAALCLAITIASVVMCRMTWNACEAFEDENPGKDSSGYAIPFFFFVAVAVGAVIFMAGHIGDASSPNIEVWRILVK